MNTDIERQLASLSKEKQEIDNILANLKPEELSAKSKLLSQRINQMRLLNDIREGKLAVVRTDNNERIYPVFA